jgi:hypothetical protein
MGAAIILALLCLCAAAVVGVGRESSPLVSWRDELRAAAPHPAVRSVLRLQGGSR